MKGNKEIGQLPLLNLNSEIPHFKTIFFHILKHLQQCVLPRYKFQPCLVRRERTGAWSGVTSSSSCPRTRYIPEKISVDKHWWIDEFKGLIYIRWKYNENTMKIWCIFVVFSMYFGRKSFEFIWCDLKWSVKNIPLPSYFSTTRCTMRLTPRRGWQTSWGSSWRRWQEDTLLCQLVGDSWIVIKVSWLSNFHPQVASGDRFSARSCTPSIPQTWQRRSRTDSLRGRTGEINYW